jgi:hypothetical protein
MVALTNHIETIVESDLMLLADCVIGNFSIITALL